MSRHWFSVVGDHRLASGKVTEGQIFRQRATVELGRDSGIGEHGLDLRAEKKHAPVPSVVEGLDAETISRSEKHTLATIPDCKGKHAAQMLDAIAAIFLIEVDDGFGIAVGAIAVSAGLKRGAQLGMVVDFSVEDDPNILVLVGERLVPGLDVNDAQPPHGQADIFFDEKTVDRKSTRLNSS